MLIWLRMVRYRIVNLFILIWIFYFCLCFFQSCLADDTGRITKGDWYAYFENGERLFSQMDIERALRQYKMAFIKAPDNPKIQQAILKTIERLPDRSERLRLLVEMYKTMGRYNDALRVYYQSGPDSMSDGDLLNSIGYIYLWRKEFDRAKGFFKASISYKASLGAYLGLADIYFFKDKYDKAINLYRKVLKICPVNIHAHRRLGKIYLNTGNYRMAIGHFRQVIRTRNTDIDAWIDLGWCYESLYKYSTALLCYKKAYMLDKSNAKTLIHLGHIKTRLGGLSVAESYYQNVIHTQDRSMKIECLNGLGWIRLWQGDYLAAEQIFNNVLRMQRENLDAKAGLGWVYCRMGRFKTAIRWFKHLSEEEDKSNTHTAGLRGLGWVYTYLGQFDKALMYYKGALKSQPRSLDVYNGLGDLFFKKGELGQAYRFYKHSIRICAFNPYAYFGLARIYQQVCKLKEAVLFLRIAVKQNPANVDFKKMLGICLFKIGKIEKAKLILDELSRKVDKDKDILLILGKISFRNSRFELAEHYFRLILSLDPEFIPALEGLGAVLEKETEWSSAISIYKRILNIESTNPTAHRRLGRIYRLNNRLDRAFKHYRRLLGSKYNDIGGWNGLGWIALRRQKYKLAISFFKKGLCFQQDNLDGLLGLSYVYLHLLSVTKSERVRFSYYKKIVKNCKRILVKHPDYMDAGLCLARLYLQNQDLKKAHLMLNKLIDMYIERKVDIVKDRAIFKEIIELISQLYSNTIAGGKNLTLKDGRLIERIKDATLQLIRYKANDAQLWVGLAKIYILRGRYKEALILLSKAKKFCKGGSLTQLILLQGDIEFFEHRFYRAEQLYLEVLSHKGRLNKPDVYFRLARLYLALGDFRKALTFAEQSVKVLSISHTMGSFGLAELYLILARSYAGLGYINKAIRFYNSGIQEFPVSDRYKLLAFKEVGSLYLKKGLLKEAESFYKRALSISTGDFDALFGLAHISRMRGDLKRALKLYRRLLTYKKNTAYIHKLIGDIYFWQRRWADAEEEYTQALRIVKNRFKNGDFKVERLKDILSDLRQKQASKIMTRFKFSSMKEDDTGRGEYVISSWGWDKGLTYTHTLEDRLKFKFGYSSVEEIERYLVKDIKNFHITSDIRSFEVEVVPLPELELTAQYNKRLYSSEDSRGQRIPLGGDKEIDVYRIKASYKLPRGFLTLQKGRQARRVKIFGNSPRLDFINEQDINVSFEKYIMDGIHLFLRSGIIQYPSESEKGWIYTAKLNWELYNHTISGFIHQEVFPLSNFYHYAGFNLLNLKRSGVCYTNKWFKWAVLGLNMYRTTYSDGNSNHIGLARILLRHPRIQGFDIEVQGRFEDFKFTAQNIGGEPIYRSTKNLIQSKLSINYRGTIKKNIGFHLNYSYSVSNKAINGHSGRIGLEWKAGKLLALNVEISKKIDPGFVNEDKVLIYLKRFFF